MAGRLRIFSVPRELQTLQILTDSRLWTAGAESRNVSVSDPLGRGEKTDAKYGIKMPQSSELNLVSDSKGFGPGPARIKRSLANMNVIPLFVPQRFTRIDFSGSTGGEKNKKKTEKK